MTEQELQEIERLFNDRGVLMRGILDDSYTCALPEEVMQAVPALIAEVRRLRERETKILEDLKTILRCDSCRRFALSDGYPDCVSDLDGDDAVCEKWVWSGDKEATDDN